MITRSAPKMRYRPNYPKKTARAFPITEKQVKGYNYAKPNRRSRAPARMTPNAGVTAVAAVNGRGSYAARVEAPAKLRPNAPRVVRLSENQSAREAMSGLSPNARKTAARRAAQKAAFSRALQEAEQGVSPVKKKRKSTRKVASSTPRKRTATARKRYATNTKPAAAPPAAKKRVKSSKKKTAKRKTVTIGSGTKITTTGSLRFKSNRRRTRRMRRNGVMARPAKLTSNRRRTRRMRRNTSAKRMTSNRRRTRRSKGLRANRRRRMRRNGSELGTFFLDALKSGVLVAAGFFTHRVLTSLLDDKVIRSALTPKEPVAEGKFDISKYSRVISGLAVAGIGMTATHFVVKDQKAKNLIAAGMFTSFLQQAIITGLTAAKQDKAIPYLAGTEDGAAARMSAMYGLGRDEPLMTIQPLYQPIGQSIYQAAAGDYYGQRGVGEYYMNAAQPQAGLGEYYMNAAQPTAGLGEYYMNAAQPTAGLGEYFDSGIDPSVAGLGAYSGNYGPNPDVYEAAAGLGAHEVAMTHIDPSQNLDRQLSMAEAQAGIGGMGQIYQAAAGLSTWNIAARPMQSGAGHAFRDGALGNIQTVPAANTVVPGMANGGLWAGVRQVEGMSENGDSPITAGVLATEGGAGIFG